MATEAIVGPVLSSIAPKIVDPFYDIIRREISYVFKYQSNVEELRSQVVNLKHRRQRLEQETEEAKKKGGAIYDDVQHCLSKMKELIQRAEKFIAEEADNAKKNRCFRGLCPNLRTRHKFSKQAVKASKDAIDLLAKTNFTNVSYRPAPSGIEIMNVVSDYLPLQSRMKVFHNVMEALKDSNVNMIGVYGIGGVGKTVLAEQIAKKVREDKSVFDEVVTAEVTQTPNFKIIQDKIASDLNFTFRQNDESLPKRAGELRKTFKEVKRVLVILDNIWKKFDLNDIGIPWENDEKERKDEQRRCTVLLTSRSKIVLRNDMNSKENFLVEVLSNGEAMSLFWKAMGDDSRKTSDFLFLADKIVKKCGGLPIAIKTIANALKGVDVFVWKDVLRQLTNSDLSQIPGMYEYVYTCIKLSYDFLNYEDAKFLFRLCGLLNDGSKIPISDLLLYGMGLGMFTNVRTLEEGRNRVYTLIHNLKDSCLLSDGDNENDVKMHEIIHVVAESIAKDDHMFNIHDVDDLTKESENEIQKSMIAISFPYRDIREFPERLKCTKLKLFLLFAKHGNSAGIPDHIFEGMEDLRVLHLTEICNAFLPSSCYYLSNLRTLSLIDCRSLRHVGSVVELKKLVILSFRGSNIEQLPEKIGQLTQLKQLDLSNCSRLKVIAPNVISKLSQLEELFMGNSFNQWEEDKGESNAEDKGESNERQSNASLVELKALSKLTSLEVHIPDKKIMPPSLFSLKLERFKIIIEDEWDWTDFYDNYATSRMLKVAIEVKDVYSPYDLNKISIGENLELSLLEKQLLDLVPILSTSSSENLIKLTVKECSKMKFLFTSSMVNSLVQLQKLEICECKSLEYVIDSTPGRDEEEQIFLKLKSLELSNLSRLTRFISHDNTDTQSFFDEKVRLTSLEVLRIQGVNTLRKIWHHQLDSDSFSNLKDLRVKNCGKLVNIFPLNIITRRRLERRFERLEKLSVEACDSIEEIIEQETNSNCTVDEEVSISSSSRFEVFPQLTTLDLRCLPNLRRIYHGIHILKWPVLKNLRVQRCDNVEILFGSSELLCWETKSQQPIFLVDHHKVGLPNLKVLTIRDLKKLRKIWHHQLDLGSFSNLKDLQVINCVELMNIFSLNHITRRRFERLEKLSVKACNSIEEIIEEETSSITNKFDVFPQLTTLEMEDLPKLKSIYQGIHILQWPVLKNLSVERCNKVEMLFGSSIRKTKSQQPIFLIDHHKIAFPNLMTLIVVECDGLINLTTLSTVESLVKLQKIEINNCEMIEEIIEQVGGVQGDPCIFSQLVYLELDDLPRLRHFCLGNFSLRFPYLEQVVVRRCPSMKIFSQKLSTPKLHKVQLTKYKKPENKTWWEGDLNCTIKKMFEQKVGHWGLNSLKLSRSPRVKEIWSGQANSVSFFGNISWLIVDDCMSKSSAIPANVLESLNNLLALEVKNCDSAEEVFHLEKVNPDKHFGPLFPKLNELVLKDLPKLERFCNFNGNIIELLPWSLSIENCPNMQTFISNSITAQMTTGNKEPQEVILEENSDDDIQPLFDEKVSFPRLEKLKLYKLPKLFHLCKKNSHLCKLFKILESLEISECRILGKLVPSSVSFHHLRTLEISKCDLLINLVMLSTAKSLANLRKMEITDCKMIKEIIEEQVGEELYEVPIVFKRLEYLGLDSLSSLTSFYLGNHMLEFPSLEKVIVIECPRMMSFAPRVCTPKLQRLQLKDKERWDEDLNSTIENLFHEMDVLISEDEDGLIV